MVRPKLPEPEIGTKAQPPAPANQSAAAEDAGLEQAPPSDWCPELMDAILSSPNQDARGLMLEAAFAAGPEIVPKLQKALSDDRTAEFAAQALAFIGGPDAIKILASLMADKRDLNLRRFFYGALGEYHSPEATGALLEAIARSDAEPDRTVTEAAILAFSVHSDPSLIPQLRQVEGKIQDVVIRDDLDNVIEVIQKRAHDVAASAETAKGSLPGTIEGPPGGSISDDLTPGSLRAAIQLYFLPAFGPEPKESAGSRPERTGANAPAHAATSSSRSRADGRPSSTRSAASAPPAHSQDESGVKVNILHLTLSPDKTRALARVTFEDPEAIAYYDMVLSKRFGNWTLASIWLGSEAPKIAPPESKSTGGQ